MGTVRAPSLTKVIMMNKLAAASFQPSGERIRPMTNQNTVQIAVPDCKPKLEFDSGVNNIKIG